jgi:hypothetical protein
MMSWTRPRGRRDDPRRVMLGLLCALLLAMGCSRATTWEVWLVPKDDEARPAGRYREEFQCEIAARSLLRRERQDLPQMTATYECRELR